MKELLKLWLAIRKRGILQQLSAIILLAGVLGFSHNASNPIGLRFSENTVPDIATAKNATPTVTHSLSDNKNDLNTKTNAARVANAFSAPVTPSPTNSFYVPPTAITWAEIKPLHNLKKVILVDARPRPFFDAGHIPGAICLPEPPSTEEWTSFRKKYALDSHIVTYCSSTNCSLSFKLAHRLSKEGYEFVQFITGGYFAWLREEALAKSGVTSTNIGAGQAALPTRINQRPSEIPAQDVPPVLPPISGDPGGQKLDNALPITWLQVRTMLSVGQVLLIDARPKSEYEQGHITGAISIPFDAPPSAVKQFLAGKPSTARFAAYCAAMGCPEAFQLSTRLIREFGFVNAQFMLEGYAEWKRLQATTPSKGTNL